MTGTEKSLIRGDFILKRKKKKKLLFSILCFKKGRRREGNKREATRR